MKTDISEVFKTIGTPSITYVERDNGKYENLLKANLSVSGKVCLITGPSKTGKTTLYQKVLSDIKRQALTIRCDDQMTTEDVWRKALEEVDFSQVSSKSEVTSYELGGSLKVGAKIGWAWLAGLLGEVTVNGKGTSSENEIRQTILSKPSYKHLIPLLKKTNYLLIIEDFHYLSDTVKTSLFQMCKSFVDLEISIVILGTTHHAVDLAHSNKDLVGRIAHIEVGTWDSTDLKMIVKKGFQYLQLDYDTCLNTIGTEAAGLPIIAQSICFKLFSNKNILSVNSNKLLKVKFNKSDVANAFHDVATTEFGIFNDIYHVLTTGLRKSSRKYNTYEMLLLIFTIDPIMFKLRRFEIDTRLKGLSDKFDVPPSTSINSTLGALGKLQLRNNLRLLEWSAKNNTLYILEPSFLFYLRWKDHKDTTLTDDDFLQWFRKDLHERIQAAFKGSKIEISTSIKRGSKSRLK